MLGSIRDAEDAVQESIPGWVLWECQIDLRVEGEWTFVDGLADRSGEPDPNSSVFTEIDRSTSVTGRRSSPSMVSGTELESDREAFMSGLPGYLDAIERVVGARIADR